MKQNGIKKLYYSISEVSAMTGLEAHVLRYWEMEFPNLKPKKNRAGNRTYTLSDIDDVKRIKHLLRDEKYTLAGARQALSRSRKRSEPGTQAELLELRAFLEDVLQQLPRPR